MRVPFSIAGPLYILKKDDAPSCYMSMEKQEQGGGGGPEK
jgi:hypothetical protein